jgi:uncharacterized protein DUF3850
MTTHQLKTLPEYWEALAAGIKTFDVRPDDRGFAVGDTLVLYRFDPAAASQECPELTFRVGYILGGGQFGVKAGYVILGLTAAPASGHPEAIPIPLQRRTTAGQLRHFAEVLRTSPGQRAAVCIALDVLAAELEGS